MTTPLHLRQSEAQFQEAVIEYAQAQGWMVHAERPARSDKGWRTPVQGDAGFPDLCLGRLRDGKREVRFLELKTEIGKLTESQASWLMCLPNAYLFRPSDWPQIEEVLA